jgi:hypothetical protein
MKKHYIKKNLQSIFILSYENFNKKYWIFFINHLISLYTFIKLVMPFFQNI